MKKIQKLFRLLFIFMICLQGCNNDKSNNKNEPIKQNTEVEIQRHQGRGPKKPKRQGPRKYKPKKVAQNNQQQQAAITLGAASIYQNNQQLEQQEQEISKLEDELNKKDDDDNASNTN